MPTVQRPRSNSYDSIFNWKPNLSVTRADNTQNSQEIQELKRQCAQQSVQIEALKRKFTSELDACLNVLSQQADSTDKVQELENEIKAIQKKLKKAKSTGWRKFCEEYRDHRYLSYLAAAVEGMATLKLFQMAFDVVEQTITVCIDLYEQFGEYSPAEKARALIYILGMLTGATILLAGLIAPPAIMPMSEVTGAALATICAYCARKLTTGFKEAKDADKLAERLGYLEWAYQHIAYLASLPKDAVTFGYDKAKRCYQSFSSSPAIEDASEEGLDKALLAEEPSSPSIGPLGP